MKGYKVHINMGLYKKKILLFSSIHFSLACVFSSNFFQPIRENAGSENIAYKFLITGSTLPEDLVSRVLCLIYSYLFAFAFVFVFYNVVYGVCHVWKNKLVEKKWIILYLVLILLGIVAIIAIYPTTITEATDTTWNYVYAKEFMPIYWHGYLTNVIHCACMILIPHPVAMSLIPFLFGISVFFYFTYDTIIKGCSNPLFKVIIWGIFLFLMPETFRVLTYAGRNYMFALLSVGYIGIFLLDYLWKREISELKFNVLAILALILGTWRSEGILYLIFLPLLLFFTYAYKKEIPFLCVKGKENAIFTRKRLFLLVCGYLIFAMPGKYGSEKYQGYDYFIVNTPAPLSTVFAAPTANLSYDGAEEDLDNIFAVIPWEYFEKYGKMAQFYYNFDCYYSPRQNHAGEQGKEYVVSSYNVLLHNWKIYLENQVNFFAESIGLDKPYSLKDANVDDWTKNTTENAFAWFQWVWAYFDIGKENIASDYDIVTRNETVDTFFAENFTALINSSYDIGWSISGYVKVLVSILTVFACIIAIYKKEWIFVIVGILILGIQMAVILTAPAMRENYYYSPYYNQYWYLLLFSCMMDKSRVKPQESTLLQEPARV